MTSPTLRMHGLEDFCTVSPRHTNLQLVNFQRCGCVSSSIKGPEPVPSNQVWVTLQLVFCLLLLMIPQLYCLPPPLPSPVSNSSCLFTWCQPLDASYCTVLLYFSRYYCCCSAAQSCLTLWPHGLHQAKLLCPSPSQRVCSNSCPSSWWCHPTISSCVVPFSSCLQSFPASGSFQMSLFFTSGGQSIGASASTSVFPVNIQDWFSLGLTGLISLWSKGLSRVFSSTTDQKHQFFSAQLSLWSNSHIHTWLLEKP